MAIGWTVDINTVNVALKTATVKFLRFNNTTKERESYEFKNVILETNAQRMALLDHVWNQHIEHKTKQDNIITFIANLEQLGKSNLEARE